jgi:hypothetical protein
MSRLAVAVVAGEEILSILSLLSNATYTVVFTGPSLSCREQQITTSLRKSMVSSHASAGVAGQRLANRTIVTNTVHAAVLGHRAFNATDVRGMGQLDATASPFNNFFRLVQPLLNIFVGAVYYVPRFCNSTGRENSGNGINDDKINALQK